jgi:hypothetical protein
VFGEVAEPAARAVSKQQARVGRGIGVTSVEANSRRRETGNKPAVVPIPWALFTWRVGLEQGKNFLQSLASYASTNKPPT